MKYFLLVVAICLLVFGAVGAQGAVPANPNATQQARNMLAFIDSLNERQQAHLMIGQFGIYGDGQTYNVGMTTLTEAFNTMGEWPAFTGADYAAPGGVPEVNRFLIDNWRRGMWVTLSWHSENPCTGGPASKDVGIPFNIKRVLPGGNCHNAWMSSLDRIATGLSELQAAGVTVIWRPFHENNGPWFWWGANASVSDFVSLWRHMFDYFTYTKGLNNLLWAFSPNHKWDQWAARVNTYYPGDQYVDIFGIDLYMSCTRTDSPSWQINIDASYPDMLASGKPLALLEFGMIPASGECWDVNPYPYRWDELIGHLRTKYPEIVMIQAWEWVFRIGASIYRGQGEMARDPWALTLTELPSLGNAPTPSVTFTPTRTPTRTPTLTSTSTPTQPQASPSLTVTPTPTPNVTIHPPLPGCVEIVWRSVDGVFGQPFVRACS